MDYNLKQYRVLNVKNNFKNSNLLFFYHYSKVKSNKWIFMEQHLKKTKLKYTQIYNGTTFKTMNNSIYSKMNQVISGIILFAKPNYKSTILKLETIKNNLEPQFILLFLKLNNKIYTPTQLKNMHEFNYKRTVLNFNCNLNKYTKVTYKLTNKSK